MVTQVAEVAVRGRGDRLFATLLGQTVLTVIDVGCRGGLVDRFAPARTATRVVGFEPDSVESARLARTVCADGWAGTTIVACALAATDGTATLHITARPDLSS